jgi:hypothetical protein
LKIMNWGKGLIIGMIIFMGFITTLVVIMMNQKIDLVTDNYYLKELEYDETYNAKTTYENASEAIVATIDNGNLVLSIPKDFQSDSIHGYLFRPNDSNNDLKWSFKAEDKTLLPIGQLPRGNYELTLTGKYNGQNFESQHELKW